MIGKRLWFVGVVLCVITACQPSVTRSPLPTASRPPSEVTTPTMSESATPAQLAAGKAGIRGQARLPDAWAGRDVRVYAAPFYESKSEGEGFFVLEPSLHPSVHVGADGSFALVNIEPGSYVLIVGPNPDEAMAVQESGTPEVFELEPNDSVDIGTIRIP